MTCDGQQFAARDDTPGPQRPVVGRQLCPKCHRVIKVRAGWTVGDVLHECDSIIIRAQPGPSGPIVRDKP